MKRPWAADRYPVTALRRAMQMDDPIIQDIVRQMTPNEWAMLTRCYGIGRPIETAAAVGRDLGIPTPHHVAKTLERGHRILRSLDNLHALRRFEPFIRSVALGDEVVMEIAARRVSRVRPPLD